MHISNLTIERIDLAARTVAFTVTCSSGTYVRSLGHDWGEALGTGGALASLRRTAIGPHEVDGAIPTADLLDRPEGSIPEWNERLKEAGIEKGSAQPNRQKVGKVTKAQVKKIAELKMADLNASDLDSAMRMVAGTARSMGLEVTD